jgi:hypothetical protein
VLSLFIAFLRQIFDFFDLTFSEMVKNILRDADFVIKKASHIFKKLIARIAGKHHYIFLKN